MRKPELSCPTVLRPTELQGAWYPSSEDACIKQLETWPALCEQKEAVGAIVPHGGWRYAGRIAFGTLRALAQSEADVLVVLGGHVDAGDPTRVFIEGDWATPLGPVPTPKSLAESVAMLVSAEPETAEAYYDDNAIEVLMPMMRFLWPGIPALVVGLGPDVDALAHATEIAEQCRAHQFRSPRVIGSLDLTHYGPDHGFRPRGQAATAHSWVLEENDAPLLRAMESLDARAIAWESPRLRNTCSPGAAAASVSLAKKLGAREGVVVAHSSSWKEDGFPQESRSFVSYAGVLFY